MFGKQNNFLWSGASGERIVNVGKNRPIFLEITAALERGLDFVEHKNSGFQ